MVKLCFIDQTAAPFVISVGECQEYVAFGPRRRPGNVRYRHTHTHTVMFLYENSHNVLLVLLCITCVLVEITLLY